METVTKKSIEVVRDRIERKVVPAVHDLAAEGDIQMYLRSGGRICRHMAVLLVKYLTDELPQYEWTAYESMFYDEFEDYDHAWVHGTDGADGWVLDYGKLESEYAFFLPSTTPDYPELIKADENRFRPGESEYSDSETSGKRCVLEHGDDELMSIILQTPDAAYRELRRRIH